MGHMLVPRCMTDTRRSTCFSLVTVILRGCLRVARRKTSIVTRVIIVCVLFLLLHDGPVKSLARSMLYSLNPAKADPIICKPRHPPEKLLTLFTTVDASRTKWYINENIVENWSLMKDRVNLILYYTEEGNSTVLGQKLRKVALEKGWLVRRCPREVHGIPVVRSMFLNAAELYTTPYYGYSNADILFSSSLLDTLQQLYGYRFTEVLMVGKRTNYNVSFGERLVDFDVIEHRAKDRGSVFPGYAQDYFISTPSGYPWHSIPDFVVGRVGYDNWLVVNAILEDIPVIDLTDTVLALHQTDNKGNFESGTSEKDPNLNYELAGKFKYNIGNIDCIQLYTERKDVHVELSFRNLFSCMVNYGGLYKYFRYYQEAVTDKTCPQRVSAVIA